MLFKNFKNDLPKLDKYILISDGKDVYLIQWQNNIVDKNFVEYFNCNYWCYTTDVLCFLKMGIDK
jgi:hypothetical protein